MNCKAPFHLIWDCMQAPKLFPLDESILHLTIQPFHLQQVCLELYMPILLRLVVLVQACC